MPLFKNVKGQRMGLRVITILLTMTLMSTGCVLPIGGALIGSAIGGLVVTGGYLVGGYFLIASYTNKEVADYQTTKQQIEYEPSSGNIVNITEFSVSPGEVRPGENVTFGIQYYVMTPKPEEEIKVIETRTIKVYDQASGAYNELGQSKDQITMKPGTRRGDGSITLNKTTPEGKYAIALSAELNGNSAAAESPLVISGQPISQLPEELRLRIVKSD